MLNSLINIHTSTSWQYLASSMDKRKTIRACIQADHKNPSALNKEKNVLHNCFLALRFNIKVGSNLRLFLLKALQENKSKFHENLKKKNRLFIYIRTKLYEEILILFSFFETFIVLFEILLLCVVWHVRLWAEEDPLM